MLLNSVFTRRKIYIFSHTHCYISPVLLPNGAPPLLVFLRVLLSVSWFETLLVPPLVLTLLPLEVSCLFVAVFTIVGGGELRLDFMPQLEDIDGLVCRTDRRCCCWEDVPTLMFPCLLSALNRWFERIFHALLLVLLL